MFRYITIVLAVAVCCSAKPAAILAPLSYGAPLFASAGTSQLDIRSGYNGAYSTALGYGAPLAARISPYAYSAPIAKYASPSVAASLGYAAPLAKYASVIPAAAYASSIAAAPYAAPYATAYGAPVLL